MEETEKREETAEKEDTVQQLPTVTLTYFALLNIITLTVGMTTVCLGLALYQVVKVHEWLN